MQLHQTKKKSTRKSNIMRQPILIILLLLLLSCSQDRQNSHRKGFIIYNDLSNFYFVPVKEFDSSDCHGNLRTENLDAGVQFNINSNEYLELIKNSAVAVKDELTDNSYAKRLQSIKILPVEIMYVVDVIHDSTLVEFEFMIYNRDVKFRSDHEGLRITHLSVLDCKK